MNNLQTTASPQMPNVEETQPEVRTLAGLQPGRLVHYVMNDGKTVRPFLVVEVLNNPERIGHVIGLLFFAGLRDAKLHVSPLQSGPSGHVPEFAVLGYAHFDDLDMLPGSWHWPPKDAVLAAGVEAPALETAVQSIFDSAVAAFRDEIMLLVNAKVQAAVQSINDMLDRTLAELGKRPADEPQVDQEVVNRLTAAPAVQSPEQVNMTGVEAAGKAPEPDAAKVETTEPPETAA